MLERVIGAFNHLGLDLDDRDIADILWLAMQIRRCNPSPMSELPQETPAVTPEIDPNTKLAGNRQNNSPKPPSKTETSANVYPQSSQYNNETSSGLPIKVPTAQALRNKLDISRSLKPLKRRVPSRSEFILDEIATAERIAEEKLLLPVMCPARDRWLEVALVIDESASMFLWQQTIKEFQQLLERHGAFRDVRTWGLFTDKDNKVWLRPRTGKLSHQKKLHNPKELIDPNGRRLFVIISDCVSPAWYNGAISKTLAMWAKTSPTTILQVLPEWLWERSALGVAESILLRSLVPGVPNQQLIMTVLDLFDEIDVCNRLKIPVVTLEPESLKNWARMVAGGGDVQTKGFLLATDGEIISSESTENPTVELTAKQRLQRFRLTASPMARKLAGLLAAAPVSLPVVRLIQQTMLQKSSQVHVAEVFLGGILKPLSPVDEDVEADKIQFDFADGVRDLLLDGVPKPESTEVLRRVSGYIAARLGLSVDEFTAMLVNPELGDRSSGVLVRPFAQITAKVLKRLGGKYAELAGEIEQSCQKPSQINISIPETISDLNNENPNIPPKAAKSLGEIKSKDAEDLYVRSTAVKISKEIEFQQKFPEIFDYLSQLFDDITIIDVPIEIFGSNQKTEPVVASDSQVKIQTFLLELEREKMVRKVGLSIITVDHTIRFLLSLSRSTREIRAFSSFAIQCIILEIDWKEEIVNFIFDKAIENISDLDGLKDKPNTFMDKAINSVVQSNWGKLLQRKLLKRYIQAVHENRNKFGCVFMNTAIINDEILSPENADRILTPLLNRLNIIFSLEERVEATLNLVEAFFRLQIQKNSKGINIFPHSLLNKIIQILLSSAKQDTTHNYAVSTTVIWAIVWLVNAKYIYSYTDYTDHTFTENELDILRQVVINEKHDIIARRYAVTILSVCSPDKTILHQADWIYEWALVADRNKPQEELPKISHINRPKDIEVMKHLILSNVPIELKKGAANGLGRLGCFIPEMVDPLLQVFLDDTLDSDKRDEAFIYLVFTGASQVISVFRERFNQPEDDKNKYDLSERCFLGLIAIGHTDLLEQQNDSSIHKNRFFKERGHLVHKLKAKDSTGRWAYYFVYIRPVMEPVFLKALDNTANIDLEDYGKVIASSYGEEANSETKAFLKEQYGYNV